MMRVEVKPELLRWACERAGFAADEMAERIPPQPTWETVHHPIRVLESDGENAAKALVAVEQGELL